MILNNSSNNEKNAIIQSKLEFVLGTVCSGELNLDCTYIYLDYDKGLHIRFEPFSKNQMILRIQYSKDLLKSPGKIPVNMTGENIEKYIMDFRVQSS